MTALFTPDIVNIEGKTLRAFRINCGICTACEKVRMNGFRIGAGNDDRIVESQVARKFRDAGWIVGDRPLDHRCPTHKPPEKKLNGHPLLPQAAPPATPAPPKMTREDKQIIFKAIEDVYNKDGYAEGHTDGTVAKGLGVPRSWVAEIRQEFFGDSGGNPEINAQLVEAKSVLAAAKIILAQVEAIKVKAEELHASLVRVQREVAPLTAMMQRVERGIADIEKVVR